MLPVLEDELPVEADPAHEGERLLELLLRLAAEADDHVGGEGHAGNHRTHVRDQVQIGLPRKNKYDFGERLGDRRCVMLLM